MAPTALPYQLIWVSMVTIKLDRLGIKEIVQSIMIVLMMKLIAVVVVMVLEVITRFVGINLWGFFLIVSCFLNSFSSISHTV